MVDIRELRKKSRGELVEVLGEGRKKIVELRMGRKTGSLADGGKITKARREVAKVLTVLREKEVLEEVATKDARKDA